MADDALLPCPFCGGDARWVGERLWIECGNCDATGPDVTTPDVMIAAWNRRAGHTAAAERIAGLEAALSEAESVIVILVGEVRLLLNDGADISKSLTGIERAQKWHHTARAALEPRP